MIKETGIVIRSEGEHIWVETSVKSTCNSCAAKANCGTSAIADAIAGKTLVNKVRNTLQAREGDKVEIGVPEETLLSGAFLIYLLPIISAIAAAFICQFWLPRFISVNEGAVILAAGLGGTLGFYFARWRLQQTQAESLSPKLISVLPRVTSVTSNLVP